MAYGTMLRRGRGFTGQVRWLKHQSIGNVS